MKPLSIPDILAINREYPAPGPADPTVAVRPVGPPRRHGRGGRRRSAARVRQERAALFACERSSLLAGEVLLAEARRLRSIGASGLIMDTYASARDALSDAIACRRARLGDRDGTPGPFGPRSVVAVKNARRPADYDDAGRWSPGGRDRPVASARVSTTSGPSPGRRGEEVGTRTGTAALRAADLDRIDRELAAIAADCRRLAARDDNAASAAMTVHSCPLPWRTNDDWARE